MYISYIDESIFFGAPARFQFCHPFYFCHYLLLFVLKIAI